MTGIYYNPQSPAAFGSVSNLYTEAKKKGLHITLVDCQNWLEHQATYTRHKRRVKVFLRRHVTRIAVRDTFCIDLIDTIALKTYNGNVQYILVCVDLFSNYMAARGLKSKTGLATKEALIDIFDNLGVPSLIWSDSGSEFIQPALWAEYGIRQYTVDSPLHCTIVERANRSLESIVFKLMSSRGSLRFIDQLPEIVSGLNARKNRGIFGLTPVEVWESPVKQAWLKKKFDERERGDKLPRHFKLRDKVRVASKFSRFDRSYRPMYSDSIYEIVQVLPFKVPTYKLSGLKGSYYEQQLSLVKESKNSQEISRQFFISTVRRSPNSVTRSGKTRSTQPEYLLKNRNDKSVSRWISESELKAYIKDNVLDESSIPPLPSQ